MVHATSLRGNPWVGQKNWILRPPALGTLRVLAAAPDKGFGHPTPPHLGLDPMRDLELDPELARRLAVAAADAPWTLGGLEEAFGTVHGVSATSLAVRVLDLMPAPPFEPQTLYRLLRELPRLRPVPVSMDTNESSVWRFDVPRYNTSADLARSLDLTISELEWFSGPWGVAAHETIATAPLPADADQQEGRGSPPRDTQTPVAGNPAQNSAPASSTRCPRTTQLMGLFADEVH